MTTTKALEIDFSFFPRSEKIQASVHTLAFLICTEDYKFPAMDLNVSGC